MRPDPSRTISRREALTAGLAAAGALALGGRARAEDSEAGSAAYGPFRMGIQSYSLRHFKTHEALHKTKELGLNFWEAYPAHIAADPAKAGEARDEAREHGVKVIGYGVIGFKKDHDANRKTFEFAKAMGIEYLSADPSRDSFESLDKLVEEYGIPIGIHNHGPGSSYEKIDTIAKAIKDHHEKIGCCLDTGHFLRSKEDPVRAAEVFGKRIYGVHLKDVKDATKFTLLGEGDLRLAEFLKTLVRLNYRHGLELEYEEHASNPIPDIRACLDAVKKAVATL